MMAASPLAGGELRFPAGLIGLPELRRFDVQPVEGTDLLELVSLDDPGFGFVAAMADDVRAGVSDELRSRGVASPDEQVIVFLAVHGDPPSLTANLAGPILVAASRDAHQVVLEDPDFPLQAPVDVVG